MSSISGSLPHLSFDGAEAAPTTPAGKPDAPTPVPHAPESAHPIDGRVSPAGNRPRPGGGAFLQSSCTSIAAHVLDDSIRSRKQELDRLSYRYLQSHAGKENFGNLGAMETAGVLMATLVLADLLAAQASPVRQAAQVGAIGGLMPLAVPHRQAMDKMTRAFGHCRNALSQVLGESFVERLHALPFDAHGVEQAIVLLKAHSRPGEPPIATGFLEEKLRKMRSPDYQGPILALRVLGRLSTTLFGDPLPPPSGQPVFPVPPGGLSERALKQRLDMLPNPEIAAALLDIAAMAQGRLDLLLASGFLRQSFHSVGESARALEEAGFLEDGEITDPALTEKIQARLAPDAARRFNDYTAYYQADDLLP